MPPPETWGPKIWHAIHYIALGYPNNPTPQQKASYKQFFTMLGPVIPCYKCSVNYQRHLLELPIDNYLVNNDKLFEWTVKLHNIVNKENGKTLWSLDQAKQAYKSGHFEYSDKNVTNTVAAVVVLTALGLGFLWMWKKSLREIKIS